MTNPGNISPRVHLSYEVGAADIVSSYSYLLRELNMSKFTQYLGHAVHRVADRRFNVYMTENREQHKHMFEWGTKGATPGSRLWKTIYIPQSKTLTYEFLPSRRLVPAADEHTKYRHKFREKAAAMEEAPVVTIAPRDSEYLRWREGGEEVIAHKPITRKVAGGVFEGKFMATFLLFWAAGGGGTVDEMAHAIRSSPQFQFEYKRAQLQGLKRRITNQRTKARTGSAKAKSMAAQRIKELEVEVIKLGSKL